jgi:hypothetical protein
MRTAFLALAVILGLAASPFATPAHAEEVVTFRDTAYAPGTIVVKTGERRLYLVLGNGKALRYVVGVGKQGKQWSGQSRIVGKYLKPAWAPPPDVKRDNPSIPDPSKAAPPTIRWARRRWCSPGASTPSTAPTGRIRSAVSSPTAASACTIATSSGCSNG